MELPLHDGVIARIVHSGDGSSFRRIVNGRSFRPTGTFVSVKGGFRAQPWESLKCEREMLMLAEVATSVVALTAQPHRLELRVRGRRAPLLFFPDLSLDVDARAISDIQRGMPLGEALLAVRRGGWRGTRTVIVEVKDDADRRRTDPDYNRKLSLAREVYGGLGHVFTICVRSTSITPFVDAPLRTVVRDRLTKVTAVDVSRARSLLADCECTLRDLVTALGGGRIGLARAHALQVRRVVAIALDRPVGPDSMVSLGGRRSEVVADAARQARDAVAEERT